MCVPPPPPRLRSLTRLPVTRACNFVLPLAAASNRIGSSKPRRDFGTRGAASPFALAGRSSRARQVGAKPKGKGRDDLGERATYLGVREYTSKFPARPRATATDRVRSRQLRSRNRQDISQRRLGWTDPHPIDLSRQVSANRSARIQPRCTTRSAARYPQISAKRKAHSRARARARIRT